jgi:hypothetical protein
MRAFANSERLANRVVKWLGYDANKIASALVIQTTFSRKVRNGPNRANR